MVAAEFGQAQGGGGLAAPPHTASAVVHAAGTRGMLLMGAGEGASTCASPFGRLWWWWWLGGGGGGGTGRDAAHLGGASDAAPARLLHPPHPSLPPLIPALPAHAGPHESVRFLPPLTISKEEVDMALGIFEAAMEDAGLRQ